jgi:hypothetical protein
MWERMRVSVRLRIKNENEGYVTIITVCVTICAYQPQERRLVFNIYRNQSTQIIHRVYS